MDAKTIAGGRRGDSRRLHGMSRIEEPLLILSGERDRTTPPRLARARYAASPLPAGRKALLIVRGTDRNDVMLRPDAISAYRTLLAQVAP